jgi:CelD/BcsL family acetyltransferase involved in cellulose biosynthesis/GNAT superfamily N-acetyltransferase
MSSLQTLDPAPQGRLAPTLTVNAFTGQRLPIDLIDRATALDSFGPFSRLVWWDSWWRHLRPFGSELFLLTVSDGDRLLGLAPWYTRREMGFGRVIRFLGDGRAGSDYMTIAVAPDRRDEVWREVTSWVTSEAGKSWDTFILSGSSAIDDSLKVFCEQIRQRDILVDQRTIANTWRVSLPESWEAYVELFSKQHRNRLRRMKRDMLDSGHAILHRVTSLSDLERGFDIQHRLHQLRRNSLGDDGCFANPGFEQFLYEANQQFLKQGKLRLQWTEIDGEPIAFDSGYVDHGGVFVYQTGFDPAKADLSPGRLHLHASILKAIEEGYEFFDFLRGDEPYKEHFRATAIPLLETRLIAPRALPRLGYRLWKLRSDAKARARRMLRQRVRSPQTPQLVLSTSDVTANAPSRSRAGRCADMGVHAASHSFPDRTGIAIRLRNLFGDCRRFGVRSTTNRLAYRLVKRSCQITVAHVLSLELSELAPPPPAPAELEYRWLTADDIRAHAPDPDNDLDSSMAERLEDGRNYCFAAFDGQRLANYSWYAVDSIEPEHSFGAGLTYPANTLYLYKAYTHPDFRGRRIHHCVVGRAVQVFAERGVSRLFALIEYANRASLRSHAKLGFRPIAWMVVGGLRPLRVERYPRLAEAMGIRFGGQP